MRRFVLGWLLLVAITLPVAAAQQVWQEFAPDGLGLIVEFPGEPVRASGVYKTALVPNGAPTHIFQLKTNAAIYTATVVDLMDRGKDGASLLEEAALLMARTGSEKRMDLVSRINLTGTAIYGRWITVDLKREPAGEIQNALGWLKAASGVEMPIGSSSTSSLFFTRGRLYMVHGMNLPDAGTQAGNAMRFAHSVNWNFPDIPAAEPAGPP